MLKDRMLPAACLFLCLSMTVRGQISNADRSQHIQASILIVDSEDRIGAWVMNPKGGDAGRLRRVKVGQKIFVPIIVTGLKTTDFRPSGITSDLQIISPDGSVLFNGKKCCGADLGDPRTPGIAVLNPVVNLAYDKGDPLGTYEVNAKVIFGSLTATASEKFLLVADAN